MRLEVGYRTILADVYFFYLILAGKLSHPYRPPNSTDSLKSSRRSSEVSIWSSVSFFALIAAVAGVLKWWVPPLLGTGNAYTLGIWLEEWTLVAGIGAAAGFASGLKCWPIAIVYFSVGYILHFPIYASDKFSFLVVAVGMASTFVLCLGICIGNAVGLCFGRDYGPVKGDGGN